MRGNAREGENTEKKEKEKQKSGGKREEMGRRTIREKMGEIKTDGEEKEIEKQKRKD